MHPSRQAIRSSLRNFASSSRCSGCQAAVSSSRSVRPFAIAPTSRTANFLLSVGVRGLNRAISTTNAVTHDAAVEPGSSSKQPPVEASETHFSPNPGTPSVYAFFEDVTSTWQYIVVDPQTKEAAVVDAVLDYNPDSGKVTTQSADKLLSFIHEQGLNVRRILSVFNAIRAVPQYLCTI